MNSRQKRGFGGLIIGALLVIGCGTAQATLKVQEGFNYAAVSPIDGTQTGGVGFAAATSWGTANGAIVSGLSYPGLAASGTNALKKLAYGRLTRSLATAQGGSTFYISMLVNVNGADQQRCGIELRSLAGPCFGRVTGGWGMFGPGNGVMGISNINGSYQTWQGVASPADSLTHLIVIKMDYASNAIKLWVDPVPCLGEQPPSATLTTGGNWTIALNGNTFDTLAFWSDSGDKFIDEARVGTTWADVMPVDPLATGTEVWWTNVTATAGASWGDSNNWVNAAGANVLPGPGHANLTVGGPSYLALYDGSYAAISNLTVGNTSPNVAALRISSPLTTLAGSVIRLRGGSSVVVTNGGVWNYVGTNALADNTESMLSIKNNGELTVAGGLLAFTNLPIASASYGNRINVGYLSTGTLRVTSGSLQYYERGPRATTNANRSLIIGSGVGGVGTLEIGNGGAVVLARIDGGAETLAVGCGSGSGLTRGTVIVSGGGLYFTNAPSDGWNTLRVGFNYGHGTLIVTNNGTVMLNAGGLYARLTIGQSPAGTGILRIKGGTLVPGDGMNAGYNTGYSGTQWATGIVEVMAGLFDAGSGANIGFAENASGGGLGYGLMDMVGGVVRQSYWGFFVGHARVGGVAYGRMDMTNGLLDIWSSAGVMDGNNVANAGLAVGCIDDNEAHIGTRAWGELQLSGGTISNAGVTVIGVNGGTGSVRQVGGTFRHTAATADKFTIVGYACGKTSASAVGGGVGTYELSGGAYYTPNSVFVGGVPTNIQYFARPNSVGLLKVAGGTFTANNTMTVGGHGNGTLTISSNGTCTVSGLVLTNNTASTLRCEFGANGLGTLTVNGAAQIATGAKLVVDLSQYKQGGSVRLLNCTSRSGAFAGDDITILGASMPATVDQSRDEDIWLHIRTGTLIQIR